MKQGGTKAHPIAVRPEWAVGETQGQIVVVDAPPQADDNIVWFGISRATVEALFAVTWVMALGFVLAVGLLVAVKLVW